MTNLVLCTSVTGSIKAKFWGEEKVTLFSARSPATLKINPSRGYFLMLSGPNGIYNILITRSKQPGTLIGSAGGFNVYGTAPDGFLIFMKESRLHIYVPDKHESEYAATRAAHPRSLLQMAIEGRLVTKLHVHQNMNHAANFLSGLARKDPKKKRAILDLFNYAHQKHDSKQSSAINGLRILKSDQAMAARALPIFKNLRLTSIAQQMLSEGNSNVMSESGNEAQAKSTGLIHLPSAATALFFPALSFTPERAAALFNYVGFFYDVVWTNSISTSIRGLYNQVQQYNTSVKRVIKKPDPYFVKADRPVEGSVEPNAITGGGRLDIGILGGFDTLTPVGGVFGQFRAFVSTSFKNEPLKFHLRLLNYTGAATPNGVVDAGFFQIIDFSTPIVNGGFKAWTLSIGTYILFETSFPLSGQGAQPVRALADEVAGQANWAATMANRFFRSIGTAFEWIKVNAASGIQQTIGQLRNSAEWLEDNARGLSNTFGPFRGQLGGFFGLSYSTPINDLTTEQKLIALGSSVAGAVGGAAVFGGLASEVAFVDPPLLASIADLGAELGMLSGALGAAEYAKKGTLSFDYGGFGYLELVAKAQIPDFASAKGGLFLQVNGFGSTPIHTFGN